MGVFQKSSVEEIGQQLGEERRAKEGIRLRLKKETIENFNKKLKRRKKIVDEISRLKSRTNERKSIDRDLLKIMQPHMSSLSDLIDVMKKTRGLKFVIMGWEIKDSSSSEEIHIDFRLTGGLGFGSTTNFKTHVEEPFIRILNLWEVRKEIDLLNKEYGVKFIFSCSAVR